MSKHVFGAIVTAHGTAANNRGLTEGNITTLQKIVWSGGVHTTVSAESIRFALRRWIAETQGPDSCNRMYDEAIRGNTWKDHKFSRWSVGSKEVPHIDDDLLGFMSAEAGKQDGEGKEQKGGAKVRRAVLEITRSVSLTPWSGDVTFNAASPGATPSAAKKGNNPVPYGTEMHATRYQYGFALTPQRLAAKRVERSHLALRGLCELSEVAGNQGRFLYDFSPESVVFRLTEDPAPRLLYGFSMRPDGRPGMDEIIRKVRAKDIRAEELVVGGAVLDALDEDAKKALHGASLHGGVRAACAAACARIDEEWLR